MENKKLLIKHFNGLQSVWDSRMNSSIYDNAIVFAKIWNRPYNGTLKYVIYAGKDAKGSVDPSNSSTYTYEIPNIKDFKALLDLLSIDGGLFTNDNFIEAIENLIKKVVDASYIEKTVNSIIKWEEIQGDSDITVNNI